MNGHDKYIAPDNGLQASFPSKKKPSPKEIEMEVRATVANVRENSSAALGAGPRRTGRRGSNESFKRAILAPFAQRAADTSFSKKAYAMAAGAAGIVRDKNGSGEYKPMSRSEFILAVLDCPLVQGLIACATLCALFGPDFFLLYAQPNSDKALDALLCVTLIIFLVELVLSMKFRKGYVFSFFFWLDFVALISLLPDISFIWDAITSSDEDQENLAILRAGRMFRAGTRTSRALRLLRVVRFARVLRIFRLLRLLRFYMTRKYLPQKGEAIVRAPNKLGLRLADLLGKRVIIGTILLLLVMPYLEVHTTDSSPEDGFIMVQRAYNMSDPDLELGDTFLEMYKSQQQEFLLEVKIKGEVKYRNDTLYLSSWEKYRTRMYTDDNNYAELDETIVEQQQARLNIVMTFLLVFLMGLSSFFFNRDVQRNVVRPIHKTTTVVRKLARTLYLLSQEDDDENSKKDDENLLESHFIDTVMDQLITFFNVDEKGHEKHLSDNKSGKIHPSSRNHDVDSVLFVEEDPGVQQAISRIDDEKIESLKSFDSMFADKQSLQFFKVFLTSEFAVESLLFVEQVDVYKDRWAFINRIHGQMIHRYIDESAQFQVNINDSQRSKLLAFDGRAYAEDLYDEARKEIYKQLERDNFPRFLKSIHAENLRKFKKTLLLREQMNNGLTSGEATSNVDPYNIVRIVKTFTARLKKGSSKPTSELPTSPVTANPDIGGGSNSKDNADDGETENEATEGALTTRSEPPRPSE